MKKLLIVVLFSLQLALGPSTTNAQGNLGGLTIEQQVQLVYIGLLGRAADREGLVYWADEITRGVFTIELLRGNIVNFQSEYLEGLGQLPRDQLVAALYQNLFRRQPDIAGLEFWTTGGGLTVSIDRLVLALINGAGPADLAALNNKAAAAAFYTQNYVTYNRDGAKNAVQTVDGTPESLAASIAQVEADGGNSSGGGSEDTGKMVVELFHLGGQTRDYVFVPQQLQTTQTRTFRETNSSFGTDETTTDTGEGGALSGIIDVRANQNTLVCKVNGKFIPKRATELIIKTGDNLIGGARRVESEVLSTLMTINEEGILRWEYLFTFDVTGDPPGVDISKQNTRTLETAILDLNLNQLLEWQWSRVRIQNEVFLNGTRTYEENFERTGQLSNVALSGILSSAGTAETVPDECRSVEEFSETTL